MTSKKKLVKNKSICQIWIFLVFTPLSNRKITHQMLSKINNKDVLLEIGILLEYENAVLRIGISMKIGISWKIGIALEIGIVLVIGILAYE